MSLTLLLLYGNEVHQQGPEDESATGKRPRQGISARIHEWKVIGI